jgi:hypothetical protein
MIPPSLLVSLSWNGTRAGPTAAVERAHSDRARSGSKGSARVSFHSFHRARSASKKDGLAAPFLSFSGRALREHGERISHPIPSHISDSTCPIQFLHHINHEGSGRGCPLLRASSDHCFIVGALRARRAPGHSPHASSAPTGPRRPTTSLRPSRPAAPTRPSASICSIIRAARG